jgi:hypothetical protein
MSALMRMHVYAFSHTWVQFSLASSCGQFQAAETLQEADEAWDPDTDEDRVLQGVVGGEFMCCQRQSKTPMLKQKYFSARFVTILIASWSFCG